MGREDKRGNILTERMVLLLLAVVALLILSTFMINQMRAGAKSAKEEKCRASIQLHSHYLRTSGEEGAPNIDCAPEEVVINNRNDEVAKKEIANQLVFCWDRWQHGDIELFKEGGSYCNPCSILTFKKKNKKLGGLSEYLEKTKMTNGMTYAKYLFPKSTTGYKMEQNKEVSQTQLDTNQKYAIVFYYDKNHSMKRYAEMVKKDPAKAVKIVKDSLPGIATGSAVGGVAGGVAGGVVAGAVIGCTVITGGICGLVVGAGAAVGALVVGGITLAVDYNTKHPYPEWYALVVIIPNEGGGYNSLGCSNIFQQGVPKSVDGAENI